jgi:hypothetical protein
MGDVAGDREVIVAARLRVGGDDKAGASVLARVRVGCGAVGSAVAGVDVDEWRGDTSGEVSGEELLELFVLLLVTRRRASYVCRSCKCINIFCRRSLS